MLDEYTTPEKYRNSFREFARRFRELNPGINPGFVYFVGWEGGPIKIGYSKNVRGRLAALQVTAPHPLRVLAVRAGCVKDECVYHKCFAEHRLHGEWFSPHPDILAEIERLKGGQDD